MNTRTRAADRSVGIVQIVLRLALALAVALLSLPLLGGAAQAEEGDVTLDTASTEETLVEEAPPSEETPPPPVEEIVEEEPLVEEQPPIEEEPVLEPVLTELEPVVKATEEQADPLVDSTTQSFITTLESTLALGDCNPVQGSVDTWHQNVTKDYDPATDTPSAEGNWENGNINAVKGDLAEGAFVWQRLHLTDLAEGPQKLVFTFDRIVSEKYAYDYFDHFFGSYEQYGGPRFAVTFSTDVSPTDPTAEVGTATVTWIQEEAGDFWLFWGAHVASELDWGPGTGAGSINGSPYHQALVSLNCKTQGVGSRDNQIMAAAIPAGHITIVKDAQPNSGDNFPFNISRSDNDDDFWLDDDGDGAAPQTAGDEADPNPNSTTYYVSVDTYTVTELVDQIAPAGVWSLTDISCVNAGNKPVATFDYTDVSAVVTLLDDSEVTCTFTNKQTASLVVDKQWVINGQNVSHAAATDPNGSYSHLGLSAQLTLQKGTDAAEDKAFGTTYDYLAGQSVTIDETSGSTNDLCGPITESINVPGDSTPPAAVTLAAGSNGYTITNSVTCAANLTLVKQLGQVGDLGNGPAQITDWTLSATKSDSSDADGPSGDSGTSGDITAGGTYTLGEQGKQGEPTDVYDLVGWSCDGGTLANGNEISVAAGRSITCTATNTTSRLVLAKTVVNENNGTADASDFTLYADPGTPNSGGDDLVTAAFEEQLSDSEGFWVDPGTTFTVTENGDTGRPAMPAGYEQRSLVCAGQTTDQVTPAVGQVATCTFTNADQPGSLTLTKIVAKGINPLPDIDATDWALSATPQFQGQPTISGNGSAAGSAKQGQYLLAEDPNPGAGWTTAGWTCVDTQGTSAPDDDTTVPVNSDLVQVNVGQNVACKVTNTAITPTLTLEKEVTDPSGTGTDLTGLDLLWTLVADTDGTSYDLSGTEGSSGATGTVPAATYVLSESGGVSGFELVGWSCFDEGSAEDLAFFHEASQTWRVTLGLDQDVTCEAENAAVASTYTVAKSSATSDPATVDPTVVSGEVITYTITATSGQEGVPILGAVVVDDLSDVLGPMSSYATLNVAALEDTYGDAVSFDPLTMTLTWTIASLSDTAEISYLVTVGDVDGATLRNHVTSAGSENCPVNPLDEDPDCTTVHHTPEWTLDKSVAFDDADEDGFVLPGQQLTYTLTVQNLSADADAHVVVEDDLSDVFAFAGTQAEKDAIDDHPELELDGDVLTWTPPVLAPGDPPPSSDEIDYVLTVHVESPDIWGQTLTNVATPTSDHGRCIEPGECTTSTTLPRSPQLTLEKAVDLNGTGDEATDTDWTLVATGGGTELFGVEGDAAITDRIVPLGTYELAETGGPQGREDDYALTGWECYADTDQSDNLADHDQQTDVWTITIGIADRITCEVTNTAIGSSYTVVKSAVTDNAATDDPTVVPGEVITYTVTLTKSGTGVPVEGITVTDDLSEILPDKGTLSDISASSGTVVGPDGDQDLTWNIPELDETPLTLTYQVTVADVDGATLRNHVTSDGSDNCPPDVLDEDPDCTTVHHTPDWTLDKSSSFDDADGDGLVMPGQTITYTLTARNVSDDAAAAILVVDDLSEVLAFADLDVAALDDSLSFTGTSLTWNPGTLPPGDPEADDPEFTVSYTVTVDTAAENPAIWDKDLVNAATPASPGGDCIEPDECTTTTTTPPVTTLVVKKVDFETSAALAGATFELYVDKAPLADPASPVIGDEDTLVSGKVSGADGLVKWGEILQGDYLVEETDAPDGYLLPEQPVMAIKVDASNFVAGGEMAPILFRDVADGQLAILAKRQFELVGAEWVESDGIVDYGDLVKYVISIEATGPKLFHDVEVSDYVPGFDPADTVSTVDGSLVPGSAVCLDALEALCEVTVGADNLVTWSIGNGSPITDVAGAVEFVVQFPELPDDPAYDENGEFTSTMRNVAALAYTAIGPDGTPVPTTLTSNEVLVDATAVQPIEPVFPPLPPEPPKQPEGPVNPPEPGVSPKDPILPNTGAPAYMLQLAVLGGLVLLLGLAMTLAAARREGEEPGV